LVVALSLKSKEVRAFQQGLQDAGYVDGRDVVIEWRSADGDYARLPALAADLVQRKVDIIFADTTLATRAVKDATSSIPTVFALPGDPVGSGLVASLAHPGGNITGLSTMLVDLAAKQLQLLKEAIPRLTRVAVLWNPDQLWHPRAIEELKAAAPSLSIQLSFVGARTPADFGPAFSAIRRTNAKALYLPDAPLFFAHRTPLLELASKARLPSIHSERNWVEEGALMSYGANYPDQFRRAAAYVDKILKGAKPGDLPIEQPTKFELVVNMKTAKALGIKIPESIMLQADEVIR
jgi:putative ABC transport system substrate-binding protein